MSAVRALVWNGPEGMELRERPAPLLGPGQLLVEVTSAGVCGTDLAVWRGQYPDTVPGVVMGHEFGGIVTAVGDGCTSSWKLGAAVAVDPNLTCGGCAPCQEGSRGLCAERRLMGLGTDGGFQTRVAIDEDQAVPLPDDADPRSLGLIEPVAVGVHACARAGLAAGQKVGIIGGGPIGLAIALQAKALGAADVAIIEPDASRRSAIIDRGTKALPNAKASEDCWDVVFDTVAAAETLAAAAAAARRGGVICVVGLHGGPLPPSDILVRRELTATGSFCYTHEDLRTAARLVSAHGLEALLVDIVEGLAAAPEAIKALSQGQLGRGKALILP